MLILISYVDFLNFTKARGRPHYKNDIHQINFCFVLFHSYGFRSKGVSLTKESILWQKQLNCSKPQQIQLSLMQETYKKEKKYITFFHWHVLPNFYMKHFSKILLCPMKKCTTIFFLSWTSLFSDAPYCWQSCQFKSFLSHGRCLVTCHVTAPLTIVTLDSPCRETNLITQHRRNGREEAFVSP